MKNNRFISRFYLMVSLLMMGYSLSAQVKTFRCGNEFGYDDILKMDPDVGKRYQELESFTQQYIRNLREGNREGDGPDGARALSIVIPVVVHIVWNKPEENISDDRVFEQINRLNLDFQRLNADANKVPAEFAGVAANMQLRFQLAVRDTNCKPTTGITRRQTTVTSFDDPYIFIGNPMTLGRNPVMDFKAGGVYAWPTDRYLNIWVCNLSNNTGGYSSFPGWPAYLDGVVVDYEVFGNTSFYPYHLGRTATHEIGHYFNLFHTFNGSCTFGTTAATCESEGDRVCDTPPTIGIHFGCPSDANTCTETPDHKDQWMNYMDYTDDACKYMFTSGQKKRLDACLYGARKGLLASDALVPGIPGATADLWSQDDPDDIGAEPNNASRFICLSEDIWVRHTTGTIDQEHQNPISGAANIVYVRVRNRVCGTSGTATVRLFWAKASPSLSWPAPWDGKITGPPVMGGEIGTAIVRFTGDASQIAGFRWDTPDIADYASFGADAGHFCLLARIETAGEPDFGLSFPNGTGDLVSYVKNNNNIVWKNVGVVPSGDSKRIMALVVGNMNDEPMRQTRFIFNMPRNAHGIAFTDVGKIKVTLGQKLYALWEAGGGQGNDIVALPGQKAFEISASGAYIGGFAFKPKEIMAMKLNFTSTSHQPWATHKQFFVYVEQKAVNQAGAEYIVGGQSYVVRNPKTRADDLQDSNSKKPNRRWLLSAHVGFTKPLGGRLDFHNIASWLGEVDIEYRVNPNISVELLTGQYNFKSEQPLLYGKTYITGFTLYGRWLLAPAAPTSVYLAAGPGLYIPRHYSGVAGGSAAVGLQRNLGPRLTGELSISCFWMSSTAYNARFATAKLGIKLRL